MKKTFKKEDVLNFFPFLKNMQKNEIEMIMNNKNIVHYPKGKIMMEEGRACNNYVFILDGVIRVYKISEEGKEVTLYRLGKGDTCVLVLLCLMGNRDYPAFAEVDKDVTMMTISIQDFKSLFYKSVAWQEYVFGSLAQKLVDTMMVVDEIAFKKIDKRIANFILEKLQDGNDEIRITHAAIASELGTAREVVSRILKDIERKGGISISRGKIKVLDMLIIKKIRDM